MALDGGAAVWTCVDGVDKPSLESIGLDRSRKIAFGRIARKPAPMLVLRTLTVKMTVKIERATCKHFEINSLEGSLMIEWE